MIRRPWWRTLVLLGYNTAVMGALAAYWLWLTKSPFSAWLEQLWHRLAG